MDIVMFYHLNISFQTAPWKKNPYCIAAFLQLTIKIKEDLDMSPHSGFTKSLWKQAKLFESKRILSLKLCMKERKTGSLHSMLANDWLDLNYFPNLISV